MPSHADFVHLRVHTAYSLSEGAIKIKQLTKLCEKMAMPAVGIADTGNLFGGLEFSTSCADAGIQPIIGCQVAVRRDDGAPSKDGRKPNPDWLVLLCQNEAGYSNLLKLVSKAYLETDAGETPQVRLLDLEVHAAGLLVLTGAGGGPVNRLLTEGQADKAEILLARLAQAFPGRTYVELQRHGINAQDRVEPALVELAYKHGLPLVATNEPFFADRAMYEAHDALICIAEGAYVAQEERRRLTPEHYFKSPEEMRALFADLPEACDNTLVVAKRCAFMVFKRKPILPPYRMDGLTEAEVLRKKCLEGLEARLEKHVFQPGMTDDEKEHAAKPYRERIEYEIGVIEQMGFPGYFLIVSDFIQWSKAHDIPVGPGRGSGAGSAVAWALTITDLDPLRWGLLFERFLNPERVSMPDFDIDFCQDRREETIRYVQDKYGYAQVAQIITFGKLQARAVLRDVGRVLQMPYGQVDRICKLVPNNPANPVTLEQALEVEPQLKEARERDEAVGHLIDLAMKLEGLYRHASTHAAGVVIGDRSLDELVPLYRDPRSDMPVTQFNMKWVEAAGLVKFDFLGLKTLSVMITAIKHIKKVTGTEVDLSALPLDDQHSYELLTRGDTAGVFQLESSGMRDVLRKMRPNRLEDLIAVVALYRPGPMDQIPRYIACKHGLEQPDYMHPLLEPILKETFGIMVYQEQVMQIAQVLSGYSLGGADLLRRAMGKKIKEEMEAQRKAFVDGAVARGVDGDQASMIFDKVAKFAEYGFNKSHAAAYALIAYQTAWLKANHPAEFMAATMTYEISSTDKLNAFRQELDRLKIKLLPPDINKSRADFSVEKLPDGTLAVRYALAALKNVGEGACRSIADERDRGGPYKDLFDFARRLDTKQLNRRQMENMVRAGVFDSLEKNRGKVFKNVESLMRFAAAEAESRGSQQMSLLGGNVAPAPKLENAPDWSPHEKLSQEFDAIGFYLSAHPLDAFAKSLKRLGALKITELPRHLQAGGKGRVKLAGNLLSKQERTSAKGSRYAFLTLSDASGMFEVTCFSEVLNTTRELLEAGGPLLLEVDARLEDEQLRLTCQRIASLDQEAAKAAAGLRITIRDEAPLPALAGLVEKEARGRNRITIVSQIGNREVEIGLKQTIQLSPAFMGALRSVSGIVEVEEI
ncbi:DNA polymerase III subunit alpha [Magnetospirillum moscoviense]|uniref:DNA polymerase III subunit alpha n=1 Tax=Magnetospirillum moscoviense TaxID=1437059 RepID=A0A178MCU6_9PROT|nr:DNA polymerase III subunit alpha [Magnetospirillum moscoviense]OAN46373.1 DNA polymerase III subunit alpha [Magnetospirillum moscoviense]